MFLKIIHAYTRRTLVRDLTLGLALAVVVVLAVLSLLYYFFYTAQLERDLDYQATHLVEQLSGVLGVPLWNLEKGTVEQIGAVYQQAENVIALRIFDETGRVIFESGQAGGADIISKSRAITYQDHQVGRVEISLTKQRIEQARQNILSSTLIVGFSVILVIVVITQLLLRRLLNQPLTRLAFGIDAIATGNYTHLLPPLKQVDIDFIAHRVNAMADQIAERDRRLWDLINTLEQEITERKRAQEALNKRLVALTEPLETADISFTDLFNLESIQKIQDAFAQATQVASLITQPDGTPITQPSCFCRLCVDIIRQTDRGRANCFYSDTIIGRQNQQGPIIQPCFSGGLWDAGASITVGGKHIANWLIGQVKNEAIDEEKMLRYADEIGADKEEFLQAMQEVPVMSTEQFQKVADAMFLLATELSLKAYQNIQQARFITQRKQAEAALRESEARLRTLIDNLPFEFWAMDTNLCYVMQNATSLKNYGNVVGKCINELGVPPEIVDLWTEQDRRVLSGQILHEEYEREVEGEKRMFENLAAPVLVDGVAIGIVGVGMDVTERKRAEEVLRLNESRLKALLALNQMAEASLQEITDFCLEEGVRLTRSRIGYLAFMNEDETVLTMHSWSKEAMAECEIEDKTFIYPVETTGLWGEAVRQRQPVITNNYSTPNPLKRGYPLGHVPVTRHMNIPLFEGERIVAVAGVGNKDADYDESDVRQLTLLMQGMWRLIQRKRAEEELEKYRQHLEDLVKARTAALEEANAELSQYAYVVSHDLRAPLRAIHNYADFLREDLEATLEGDQKMYLNGLGQVVREAEVLVEDLLELSRIGRRSNQKEMVDLGTFLGEVIASLKLEPEVHVIMGNHWPSVEAEPALLRQIFQNLIDNAIKFNTASIKRIELGWQPAPGEAYELFVRDNGIGIAPHYHEQIFRVFERLHTREEYEGTGVGLAIVKKAAGKLHGSIRLESEPGKGSTFFVTIPKTPRDQ